MKRILTLIAALACFSQMFASYRFCFGPNLPRECPELTLGSNVVNITEHGLYFIFDDENDTYWYVDGESLEAPFASKEGTWSGMEQSYIEMNDAGTYIVTLEESGDNLIVSIVLHNSCSSLSHVDAIDATCTTTGNIAYYQCTVCGKAYIDAEGLNEISDVTVPATGHSYNDTWNDITGGKTMACSNGCGVAPIYCMDAAGKNAIALTLASEAGGTSKLTFPFIENQAPVLTQDDDNYTVAFSLEGSAETMTIQKSLISKVSVLWSHDFTAETQNADKSYTHKCSVTDCDVMGDDLYVKINGENVDATKDGDVLKVSSLVLTDDKGYSCEAALTVGTATYNRTMTNQWGTLCLPMSLTVDEEKNLYDFYTLTNLNGDELTITKVADGTLAAGTPVIVRRNTAESGITISETNASVCTTPATGSTAGDLTLTGTYTTEDISGQNGYFISNNAFWKIEDDRNVKVAPFRAWIKGTTPNNARQLSLRFDDEDITAIGMLNAADDSEAAIYDLQGKRLSDLRQGVNIVKFSNGQTKKIIIK